MNGYDAICEAAKAYRTTRMPEAATIPGTPVRPRDTTAARPEFDTSNEYRQAMAAAMDGRTPEDFRKLVPGAYFEAAGTRRSDGKSSQNKDGGNRYDISTPEKKRKALAAARRSDNPEDLKRLRGKVTESCLLPPIYPREAVSSGDFPAMQEAPLNAKRRNKLPVQDFAGPNRTYPIDTEARARAAISRVKQFGSPELQRRVIAAVKRRYPNMDVEAKSGRPTVSSPSQRKKRSSK